MHKTVVIIGANGFLGRYLSRYFSRQGRRVVAIARSKDGWSGDGMFLKWDGETLGSWTYALEGAELVINLAGSSVNCRYTEANRKQIMDSRVLTTKLVGEAIARCRIPPKAWFNASTATWYRHAENHPQDEWEGERGEGFSCEVAQAWEGAFFSAEIPPETRKVALRTGIVLANEPGTVYDVLSKLVRKTLGGTMGNGSQRVSWIHMDDFLRAIDHLMRDPFISGVVNITAPESPTNREWMKSYRNTIGMPIGIPATRLMLKIGAAFLETETELVLKSRWAKPQRLREVDFRWLYPSPTAALENLEERRELEGFYKQVDQRSIGRRAWLPATTR